MSSKRVNPEPFPLIKYHLPKLFCPVTKTSQLATCSQGKTGASVKTGNCMTPSLIIEKEHNTNFQVQLHCCGSWIPSQMVARYNLKGKITLQSLLACCYLMLCFLGVLVLGRFPLLWALALSPLAFLRGAARIQILFFNIPNILSIQLRVFMWVWSNFSSCCSLGLVYGVRR